MNCLLNINFIKYLIKNQDPLLLLNFIHYLNISSRKIHIFIFKKEKNSKYSNLTFGDQIKINIFDILKIQKIHIIGNKKELDDQLKNVNYSISFNIYKDFKKNINLKKKNYILDKKNKHFINNLTKINILLKIKKEKIEKLLTKYISNLQFKQNLSKTNSEVFRFTIKNNSYILKKYTEINRYLKEVDNLTILKKNRIDFIPEIISKSKFYKTIIFNEIKNKKIITIDNNYIKNYVLIVKKINSKKIKDTCFQKKLFAKEPCFSVKDVVCQIKSRHENATLYNQKKWVKIILSNLEKKLNLELKKIKKIFKKKNWPLSFDLESYIYNHNDLGLQNIILKDNKYYLIDFEYSGIDSIYKLINDFKLHPANKMNKAKEKIWELNLKKNIKLSKKTIEISKTLYPLFAIRWIYVILNPILIKKIKNLKEISKRKENIDLLLYKLFNY